MNNVIFRNRFSIVWFLILLSVCIALITRVALLIITPYSGITGGQLAGAFAIGLLYDLSVATFIVIPFVLQLWLQNDFIYQKKILPFVCVFFAGVIFIVLFSGILPKDFSPPLYSALLVYIVFRFAVYLFLYRMNYSFRIRWRKTVLYLGFLLAVFLLLLNGVSEYFFWQEFSTRYNFIAVDYLVYTTEVLGNIAESYPLTGILITLALIAMVLAIAFRRKIAWSVTMPLSFRMRSLLGIILLLLPAMVYYMLPRNWRHFSANEYSNSLAGNGLFDFAVAFQQNELDFYSFYKTLTDSTAFTILRQELQAPYSRFTSNDLFNIEREIDYTEPERKLNIVLISVESLSADFMQSFGGTKNITPYLDSLAKHSVFFTSLYSSGTRTVRGLEALTLSIPPTPGQSIVKRPGNANLFSLGGVLHSKGYITQYLYGGYSYFDNMKRFFSRNGYTVIDRSAIPESQVHYQNVWGVADEDLFSMALHVLDSNSRTGKPFFSHIMTVSNHRPYTYPEGRIDIPPSKQVRDGAVKYTDYAINDFLRKAQQKKWFDSTLFVIVADHCAGSAGKVELPVTGYHIPMLIYAPKLLPPAQVKTLTAQIDIAPTILGILKLDYRSKFIGQDVLNLTGGKERAFISTYQGLGYLRNGRLLIQTPVKTIRGYVPDFSNGDAIPAGIDDAMAKEAIAYYQAACWLLKNNRQNQ